MTSAPSSDPHAAVLAFLWDRIDFERAASVPYHSQGFKLDRMRELLARLDNPQNRLKIVHIAGTKGKGSTAAMIAAMLTAAGYRTGLFSSPHLEKVEERFAIDGEICPESELVTLVEMLRPIVQKMDRAAELAMPLDSGPTFFEITTALAILYFVRHDVHTAVLEVGMGGRLDSTNVCTPAVSVITSISFDHTKQLGNTLREIAGEKGGIIKPGVPVVSGVLPVVKIGELPDSDNPQAVIAAISRAQDCPLIQLGVDFDYTYHPPHEKPSPEALATFDFRAGRDLALQDLPLRLLGQHQAANGAVALATIQELIKQGWQISHEAIRQGLAQVQWPARIEVVLRRPTIVLDVAHNVASVAALLTALEESFRPQRRLLVFATTKDKDVRGMLELLLPNFDEVLLTRYTKNPRGVPVEELSEIAASLSARRTIACPDSLDAWNRIREMAQPDDLICLTGSFFLAAEMREHLAHFPLRLAEGKVGRYDSASR